MGVVYKGRDPFIGRLVAIKTITTGLTENKDLLQRFYREAQAAGSMQHPNIVTIFDAGEESGTPYIAMEFLEGEDLAHLVAKEAAGQGVVPPALKLSYIVRVCQALDYAHRRNIVHRDIKPGNIFITVDGTVKVVDFGIARLTNTSSTSSGMLIGTIDYMSPEQIRGEKVDGRSDIWAVGVMTYEIMTHHKPFTGSNITAVMFGIVSQEPKPLRELRPDLPVELENVIKKMFRKDVNERYQSMDELLSDLEPLWRRMQQDNVSQLVTEGESLFQGGNYQRARELLKQVLVIDTSHSHAKTLLDKINAEIKRSEIVPKLKEMVATGQKLMEAGKLDEARAEVENALRLDSAFQPARDLLSAVQKAADRNQAVQTGLRSTRQRMAEGSLTEAEQSVAQVLALAPDNPEAQSLKRQITEEKDRRNKRKRISEDMQRARQLWTMQQFQEAEALLSALLKDFPAEMEVAKLLETVRADFAQQEVQQALTKVRKHLGAQEFSEALATLDELLQRHPQETAAQKLRELVLQERKEHANRLRLQRELQALKRLVSEERYQEAIDLGGGLLKEFPEEFELARLVDYARSQKAQQQIQSRKQAKMRELQQLIEASNFDKAIASGEEALKEFAGDPEIVRLLELARSQQEDKKNRERRQLLEQRLEKIKQSIERGELTDAIDLGKRTLVQVGPDADVTRLVEKAEQERGSREEKRALDRRVETAITMLDAKKYSEATQVLRQAEATGIFDPRVDFLKKAAEEKRPLTKEDLTLIHSRPAAPAAQQDAAIDVEATQKWTAPKVGVPPAEKEKPAVEATRLSAASDAEDTERFTVPPVGQPPSAAPVEFNATSVMPPVTPEEKEATRIAPPPTEAPRSKEKKGKKGKKSEAWRPQAWRGHEFMEPEEPPKQTPLEAPSSATAFMPAAKVEQAVQPPVKQSPVSATTIAQPPSSATSIGQSPVLPPPPQPKIEERPAPEPYRERRREPRPEPAPSVEELAPLAPVAPPFWKSGMGMTLGGLALAAVLGFGIYKFMGSGNATPPVSNDTATSSASNNAVNPNPAESKPPTEANPVTSVNPPPSGPSPSDEAKKYILSAKKMLGKGSPDGATSELDKAAKLVADNNLGGNFSNQISAMRKSITDVKANAALAKLLRQESDLWDNAEKALAANQFDQATAAYNQILGLGEGGVHKTDAQTELNRISTYKQEESFFPQAQAAAQKRGSIADVDAAVQKLNEVANLHGRREQAARQLLGELAPVRAQLQSAADAATAAAAASAAAKAKLDSLMNDERNLLNFHKWDQAEQKLTEITAAGGDVTSLRAEISKGRAAEQVTATCTVGQKAHQSYDRPLSAGSDVGQAFLDAPLALNAGTNCGLALSVLQTLPKNGQVMILVNIDSTGAVLGGQALSGETGPAQAVLQAAKQSWKFNPPKVNNTPVKTSAAVTVHFK